MSGSQVMIVMIVAIVSVMGFLKARYQARHGVFEDRHGRQQMLARPDDSAATAEMQRELEVLRERVKVLERIATDDRGTRQLASEIEALRDK